MNSVFLYLLLSVACSLFFAIREWSYIVTTRLPAISWVVFFLISPFILVARCVMLSWSFFKKIKQVQ